MTAKAAKTMTPARRRSSAALLSALAVVDAAVALNAVAAADHEGVVERRSSLRGDRNKRSSILTDNGAKNDRDADEKEPNWDASGQDEGRLDDRRPLLDRRAGAVDEFAEEPVNLLAENFDSSSLIPKVIPSLRSAKDAKDTLPTAAEPETEPGFTEEEDMPEKLIVGGSTADTADYPFFAMFRGCDKARGCYNQGGDYDWGGCGATLISSRHILTAGHCVAQNVQNELDLKGFRIGGSEWSPATWQNAEMHPRYDENNYDMPEFDAAIVTLPRDVSSTPAYVDTGSIADTLLDGTPVYTAIGHGKTSGWGSASSSLLEADLFGLEDFRCTGQYGRSYHTSDDSMLCAGQFNYNQYETSTCNGDSGGPLLSMTGAPGINEPVLLGITSWGPSTCNGGVEEPSVFAKVGKMVEWFGPTVCNSFDYREDQPDWCRVCDNTSSGWCGRVRQAGSRVPIQPSSSSSTAAPPTQSSSSSTAAPPAQGSSTTTTSSSQNLDRTDYTQACKLERRNKHCNYDNPNKPFCTCGWMADMLGPSGVEHRRQKCGNAKVQSACPNTCQERCSR